jgi:hypothetical protein
LARPFRLTANKQGDGALPFRKTYEAEHARLTVSFTTGRVYQYFLVPPDVAAAFRMAFSKGTYFNARIRDHYTFREVTPAAADPAPSTCQAG